MTAVAYRVGPLGRPSLPLLSGAAAVAFGVAGLLANDADDGFIICPLRRCSGGYCPGCGLTRSAGRLMRGDIAGSWARHPFLLLALVQAALLGALWRFGSARHQTFLRDRLWWLLVPNTAVLLGIWVTRLITGTIPVPFS